MKTIRERHDKTPLTLDFDVVIKKAYCNFEQIEQENEAKIQRLINDIRAEGPDRRAA